MIHTPRLKYHRWSSGHVPLLQVHLLLPATKSRPIDFLLDTGASFSLVQRFEVKELLDGSGQEQHIGVKDASGKWLKGIPLDIKIRLVDAPQFPEISERIWICTGTEFNLLGQTFLEKVSAHFMNFPQNKFGRYFSLSLSPYHALPK